ncbi:MAG: dinitrogenase iron-molybdenum cofactor biosynthesis protein [Rhodocyclaceae bacterium]|nr:dinitrogenase iron-molybdenum cofactor biosynthesis protein [Rhodocyclaceae bacterium]
MTETHEPASAKDAVQRLAEAARLLPEGERPGFVHRLAERLGLPLDLGKLTTIAKEQVAGCIKSDDIDDDMLELMHQVLSGRRPCADAPVPEPYADGEIAGSLRVAIASNSGDRLDGHFGSCGRFLIYQVGVDQSRLIDVRPTAATDRAEDRNMARAALLADCDLAYLQSIGGPAAAKLVRAGVHPIKWPSGASAAEAIERLQASMNTPPPWLARAMGVEARSLARFTEEPRS